MCGAEIFFLSSQASFKFGRVVGPRLVKPKSSFHFVLVSGEDDDAKIKSTEIGFIYLRQYPTHILALLSDRHQPYVYQRGEVHKALGPGPWQYNVHMHHCTEYVVRLGTKDSNASSQRLDMKRWRGSPDRGLRTEWNTNASDQEMGTSTRMQYDTVAYVTYINNIGQTMAKGPCTTYEARKPISDHTTMSNSNFPGD
ncbi:hypothetical protein ACRALDRAFT_213341 [Sodiomyces alcalophilus JCM 7366]|uniref:uncharacterized protein n=1 Tax=Sodiomyces alcalophilus JCM 7366 TaxID=591952 RepID=UPI0039B4919D